MTKSAFVVRLAEAVHHPDALMATYAITPDIHAALDRGLGLVGNALQEQRNDAAFIHGSFGSGKSNFMAVLSLLADNAERAWRDPSLHDLLVKHEWVKAVSRLTPLPTHRHQSPTRSLQTQTKPLHPRRHRASP